MSDAEWDKHVTLLKELRRALRRKLTRDEKIQLDNLIVEIESRSAPNKSGRSMLSKKTLAVISRIFLAVGLKKLIDYLT